MHCSRPNRTCHRSARDDHADPDPCRLRRGHALRRPAGQRGRGEPPTAARLDRLRHRRPVAFARRDRARVRAHARPRRAGPPGARAWHAAAHVDQCGLVRQCRADQRARLRRHPAAGPRDALRAARRNGLRRSRPRVGQGLAVRHCHRARDVQPHRQGAGLPARREGRQDLAAAGAWLREHGVRCRRGDRQGQGPLGRDHGSRDGHRRQHGAGELAVVVLGPSVVHLGQVPRGRPAGQHRDARRDAGRARPHRRPRPVGRPGVRLAPHDQHRAMGDLAHHARARPRVVVPERADLQALPALPHPARAARCADGGARRATTSAWRRSRRSPPGSRAS